MPTRGAEPIPQTAAGHWLHAIVALVLAAASLVLLAGALWRHTVDLPWMDQWAFAPEVSQLHDGKLRAADLWAQHNEHRLPVTKLVLHAMAAMSGWDIRWEVAANFVVAAAIVALIAMTILRTVGPVAPWTAGGLVVLASALQTSLVQWQNWTWGWQLGLLLAEAGAVAIAAMLSRGPRAPSHVTLVVVAAVLAALSNGTGMVLLALVPMALLALRHAGAGTSRGAVFAATVTSASVVACYLVGWQTGLGQPAPVSVVANARALVDYGLVFLGNPIASWDATLAWRWGAVAIALVVGVGGAVWASSPDLRVALVPWLTLAAFALGAAALTAVGRLGAGAHTALLSRYSTFAIPLWLAIGPVLVLASTAWSPGFTRMAATVSVAALLAFAGYHGWQSAVLGERQMARRAAVTRQAAACIVDPASASDACYRAICWDAAWARAAAVALRTRRLGPWRPGGPFDPAAAKRDATGR